MIRLIQLLPPAGDALVAELANEDEEIIHYRRLGNGFMFPQGEFPRKMQRVSAYLRNVLARFGQSHLIQDHYA